MVSIPTTKEVYDLNLANFETYLNQSAPLLARAFIRVLSTVEAGLFSLLYKYGNDRMRQNLAMTADEEGLLVIGAEIGVPIKAATRAQQTIEVEAIAGTEINSTHLFIGDLNNLQYRPTEAVTSVGPTVEVDVQCSTSGTDGNLVVTDTLTVSTPISGAGTSAEVTVVLEDAIDRESVTSYRRRVLAEIRTVSGGGNATDYRSWSEAVDGVNRAFPYSGKPGGSEDVSAFVDGNCETAGVGAWSVYNSATLTKDLVTIHGGVQSLKIARNGVANPEAYQSCITEDQYYQFLGYAYSDGSAIPYIKYDTGVAQYYWFGSAHSSWQFFNFAFKGDASGELILGAYTDTGTEHVFFDDMELRVSEPGDRAVYIEAVETIDADGIAPQSLLDSVREEILNDPITGRSRPPLGEVDSRLYIDSIYRTGVYVEITGLAIAADYEVDTKSKIESAVDEYLRFITPYIAGIDVATERNDTVTKTTLSSIVQGILSTVGATANSIDFDFTVGLPTPKVFYTLAQGELLKLELLTYA